MGDDARKESSEEHGGLAEGVPAPHIDFTSLLDEELFLQRIFRYLVEYGLHDCRLVCRKWYKVCQQFPVSLRGNSFEQFGKLADAFPNTVSLSIDGKNVVMSEAMFFMPVTTFRNLKALSFELYHVLNAGRAQHYLLPLTQLVELAITIDGRTGVVDDIVSSVRHLTNLTNLKVLADPRRSFAREAFVELERIQRLHVPFDLLTDDKGTCFFPSLTNLTRLEVESFLREGREHPLMTKAFSPYSSTLQYLSLARCSVQLEDNFEDLSLLTNLRSLRACRNCIRRESFWRPLRAITSLKRLLMRFDDFNVAVVKYSAWMPRGLEALVTEEYHPHSFADDAAPLIAEGMLLKELSTSVDGKIIADLSSLTLLEHLHLVVKAHKTYSLDSTLLCMPQLQTLDIALTEILGQPGSKWYNGRLSVSGSSLAGMDRLRAVSLKGVDVDKAFLFCLAFKDELTKLEFASSKQINYSRFFWAHINLLTHLQELKLETKLRYNVCEVLYPDNFPRLEKLTVDGTEEQLASLHKKFANLGVLINRKESGWSERLAMRSRLDLAS